MFLYIITNTVNGKKYVGQTRASLHKRFINHCARKDERSQSYISNAIQKYGKENFIIEPLLEIDSQDVLNELESEFIAQFCTLSPNGYNLTTGGESPKLHDDTKAKIRAARLGKPLSEEHKRKIGEALRNSPAVKAANVARRSFRHTPESRQKMSEFRKGKPCPWKAVKWTAEMKEKRGQKYAAAGNPNSSLTWEKVDRIREMYATGGYSQCTLASTFEIDQTQISRIVLNKQWVRPEGEQCQPR